MVNNNNSDSCDSEDGWGCCNCHNSDDWLCVDDYNSEVGWC